jgi:TolA-binding protein
LQQQLTQQNQQISQLQAQIQQLQNNLQNAQGTISQASSDNSNLNSQLNNANAMNHYITYLVIAFGIIAILALVLGRHSKQPRKTQSVNPYAANYVPPQTEHHSITHAEDSRFSDPEYSESS